MTATPTPIVYGTLVVRLVDPLTAEPYVVTSTEAASVNCREVGGRGVAEGWIERGESSVAFSAPVGSYECAATLEGAATTIGKTWVLVSTPGTVDLEVIIKESAVILRALDKATGALLLGSDLQFTVWSEGGGSRQNRVEDLVSQRSTDGVVAFSLLPGSRYRASVQPGDGVNRGTASYIAPPEPIEFDTVAGEELSLDFLLTPADAAAVVTLRSSSGAPVGGFVEALSFGVPTKGSSGADTPIRTAEFDLGDDHWVGAVITPGVPVRIGLLAGRRYRVRGVPLAVSGLLPSEWRTLTAQAGTVESLDLSLKSPGAQITLLPTSPIDVEVHSLACFGYTSRGDNVAAASTDLATVSLPLPPGPQSEWTFGCEALAIEEDTFELQRGEEVHTPVGPADELEIVLNESRAYYSPHSYTVAGRSRTSLYLPDGSSRLNIPENTFPEDSSVTVTVQSPEALPVSEGAVPLTAFEFTYTENGAPVTELRQPVQLQFAVSTADLKRRGLSVRDIYPARFVPSSGVWERASAFSYNESTGLLSVSVRRFSVWGLLADAGKRYQRLSPVNLRARRFPEADARKRARTGLFRRAMRLSWEPVQGTENRGFEVVVDLVSQNKRPWRKIKRKPPRIPAQVTYQLPYSTAFIVHQWPGTYRFYVRVEGGANSEAKNFRVK